MNIAKIENLPTTLDHTFSYKSFKRTIRDNGNMNFVPSEDIGWHKNSLRSRTLLAIASRQNRLKTIHVPELPFFDEEGIYYRNVNIYFDEEDTPFIEFIIEKMNDWSHLFEIETADENENVRLENEVRWAKFNADNVPTFMPRQPSDSLVEAGNGNSSELESVKALLGYNQSETIGWARTQGWLIIIDPVPEDAPMVAEMIKPSFTFLDQQPPVPSDDPEAISVSVAATIVEKRRKERDRINVTISASRSIISRK